MVTQTNDDQSSNLTKSFVIRKAFLYSFLLYSWSLCRSSKVAHIVEFSFISSFSPTYRWESEAK